MSELRVVMATRRSMLALAQSRSVAAELGKIRNGLEIEELHVVTTGDRIQDRSLTDIGGKGLFVKEIEQALLDGQARVAVHSVKDMPAQLAPGLVLACIPKREDPRDAFLSRNGCSLLQIEQGSCIGTSSMRRRVMLARARADLRFKPLRGNVDTRIRKVREGVVDATVLAFAGLVRLVLQAQADDVFDPGVFVPAVGQGALGVECLESDCEMRDILCALHDRETAIAVAAERGVMAAVGGSCQVSMAAYACRDDEGCMLLRAVLGSTDVQRADWKTERRSWPESEAVAAKFGAEVGAALRACVVG